MKLRFLVLVIAGILIGLPTGFAQQRAERPVRITKGPLFESISDHSAVIAWSTDEQGSSRVEYGTSPHNLDQMGEAPWGADGRTHRVELRNLRPDTTYYFEVETGQARGNGSDVETRGRLSFRTQPRGAPPLHEQQPR
jgi:hypothetical protein